MQEEFNHILSNMGGCHNQRCFTLCALSEIVRVDRNALFEKSAQDNHFSVRANFMNTSAFRVSLG